ncbi:hypothetical protein BS50DRAFT_603986 [Corynespora cassiicola Philippines]|uniref:UbiA prenyltransferase n=1 Tax=Corynespora cassiicola Philippines TaxID=1448308 RepID=A0A2T2N9H0_CORCC|nr:hypothetical protein BS50DRAFT_603986 [Corynespora cassiicola Philippines]
MQSAGRFAARAREDVCYHAYTIWLFTRSDLKTIVVPKSIFGIMGALPGSPLTGQVMQGGRVTTAWSVVSRIPLVVFWVWIVLLPFNIDNQRRPAAVEEDAANRPWRPLPAQRMSPKQAARLEMVLHSVAVAYSWRVGGLRQSLTGMVLGWVYNGLGGADRSCVAKNAVNALGYVTFSMGAVSVAARAEPSECGVRWFWLVGAVVFSTVQMQDLPDMEGDALRRRRTVPLVIGPDACRWSVGLLVPFWTAAATLFWGVWGGWPLPGLACAFLAVAVSWRVLTKRHRAGDQATFRLWNLWMVSLYLLPLVAPRPGEPSLSAPPALGALGACLADAC